MMNPTQNSASARSEDNASADLNMRPVTVLLGIVMGTVGAVASGLLFVCLIFWILKAEYPRLSAEIPALAVATSMFTCLSLLASLSFYGSLKSRPWRHITMFFLWAGIAIVGWYFWPE
jgi:hypothetical protein